MRRNMLQYLFWAVSAVMIAGVCLFAIPDGLSDREVERITLRELVPTSGHYYLYVGGQRRTTAVLVPDTAITALSWSSSDDSIVQVGRETDAIVSGSDTGTALLAGSGVGRTTVTVDSDNGVTASFDVTVVRAPLPPDSDLPPLYDDRLLVVNVNSTISADYVPELVSVPSKYAAHPDMKMTAETLEAYERMYADAYAATGQRLTLMSSYRSYAKQKQLYDADVSRYMAMGCTEERARELTGRTQQPPGSSEHQLGDSLDLGQVSQSFEKTAAGQWVRVHAHEYGFVMRYPADKAAVTGISYESWHFRHVGLEHARYIYEHGLCIEEYVALQEEAAELARMYASTLTDKELAKLAAAR